MTLLLLCYFIYVLLMLQVAEKGHVKPANYLDSHEKFLIGIATKGGILFLDHYFHLMYV